METAAALSVLFYIISSNFIGKICGYAIPDQRLFAMRRDDAHFRAVLLEMVQIRQLLLAAGLFPLAGAALLAISPALWPLTLLYFAYDYLVFSHFNLAYLERASPWGNSYWVTLLTLALPLQILSALLAPQRIIWRGHLMQAEAGGGFEFVQRRKK
jgi:hypothetical protein